MIYFDNASTTKPCEACVEAIVANMRGNFGNPSSLHKLGINAEKTIAEAKKILLERLDAEGEIYFTSCATESNNTAIRGITECYGKTGRRIVTTSTEHPSVARVMDKAEQNGFEVVRVSPGAGGDFEEKLAEATDENTILLSAMAVNNETGFLTDTKRLYALAKRKNKNCVVHCDGVQAFCKTPIYADIISLSAHKIHGPKGIGALFVRKGVRISPLLLGGGQQKNLRSGTEAVDMIAGFAAAVKDYPDEKISTAHFSELNAYLLSQLEKFDDIRINSRGNLSNILNFSVMGVRSEIMLHFLEEKGIYVSSGSACSKGKTSGVLSAFGITDDAADSALRISFCHGNTTEEIDALVSALGEGIERFRKSPIKRGKKI